MRAGDENPQESVTQVEAARVEGGTATLSNQKAAAKRSGYCDNDEEENVDQRIKSSGKYCRCTMTGYFHLSSIF